MAIDRGLRARIRYRWDEFLSGGAGRQLMFLFALTIAVVVLFTGIGMLISAFGVELKNGDDGVDNKAWFYFTRMLDAGTMGDDEGDVNRALSTGATIVGVVVAGLLISSLAGNFQERLEAIKRGESPVMERGHFLILGWSEKIYSVIDQISEAYAGQKLVVVVMAEGDKVEMEGKLHDKVVHQDRVKMVVRAGSSLDLNDLARVAFDRARAIVVLLEDGQTRDPNLADGRIIKTLLALYNHPDSKGQNTKLRVTAEVMQAQSQEIAVIASGGRAQVVKTNEIISKIILQTSRISGLSVVYDQLLRFEGAEFHMKQLPVAGRLFSDLLLDFPHGLPVGVAKIDGSGHLLNPPADHVIQNDEALLILAEDANIVHEPYRGPLSLAQIQVPGGTPQKRVEHMLILGWNPKLFPIIEEFDAYVGAGSTLTLVNGKPEAERMVELQERCPPPKNTTIYHVVGEFTSRALMDQLHPERYPRVMVLGDATGGTTVEEADTRAIIALLLLRHRREQARAPEQEVCSEILDPKNRDLAATTEIDDIVISNEMVSMVLAQITYEPRIQAVLEDLFRSEGSEIYLKDLAFYVPPGHPCTFEYLTLAARRRGEVVLGLQRFVDDAAQSYGIKLNPDPVARRTPFVPTPKDRLIVLAEDDG
jgi:ion channel POLLUX/CASTOR